MMVEWGVRGLIRLGFDPNGVRPSRLEDLPIWQATYFRQDWKGFPALLVSEGADPNIVVTDEYARGAAPFWFCFVSELANATKAEAVLREMLPRLRFDATDSSGRDAWSRHTYTDMLDRLRQEQALSLINGRR
jgi:hypothetical protein